MTARFASISLLFLALINSSSHALAYEVQTHEKMTERAAIQSNLAFYLPEIGFLSLDDPLATFGFTNDSRLDKRRLGEGR